MRLLAASSILDSHQQRVETILTLFLSSQFLATCAFILDVSAFFLASRPQTLRCLALSTLLMSVHFMLLSQLSAAVLMLIASSRYLIATRIQHKSIMWIFIVLSI
ncbi:YgjV family protein, partial [Enterobacter cloacae]